MENLLYYPYINFPKTDWTIRTLLYYNQIGAITPQRYFEDPQVYEPFMLEMVQTELVLQINPFDIVTPNEISDPFINYIRRNEGKMVKRRRDFLVGQSFYSKFSQIHVDKFDNEIFYQLKQAGLARRSNDQWFDVERRTANELMIFLAGVIGERLNYLPATDSYKKRFSLANRNKKVFKIQKHNQIKRELILDEMIPFSEQISIWQLRDFKDRYLDLLISFRRKVERIALDPHLDEDSDLFRELLLEMKENKAELAARMSETGFSGISFGTICGVSSAVIGSLTADGTSAAIGAVLGTISALGSAYSSREDEDIFDQSGMKYLALVDKRIRNS